TTGSPIEEALPHAEEAIRLNKEIGHDFNICMSYLTLAKVYYYFDDYAAAMPVVEQAMSLAEELGFPSLIAHAQVVMSNLYLHQDQYREAVQAAIEVLQND